jgi:CBS domain-containing protein
MNVDSVLKAGHSQVLTVRPGDTVLEVAHLFKGKRSGMAIVCDDDDHVIGVVSLGDIVHAIGERAGEALNLPVEEIMTSEVAVCEPDDDIEIALETMKERGIRHLPVVRKGKLVGFVEQHTALECLYEDAALDFSQLRTYVFKTGDRF